MITDEISFYIKGYDNHTAVEQMQKYPQMRRILAGDEERSDEEILRLLQQRVNGIFGLQTGRPVQDFVPKKLS